ncbi:MAG: 3-deoxy-manno-octulosonate cytidylyltransferase [Candidatus Omnitrophica bacterium]|nr:3-deoxy-manno-octulosonate cytidylyltransferase [Candidatus Omnitrophota bacterium]
MNIIAIIPARMASTRYPGKPMAKINGIPMIGHVYHRCKLSTALSDVYVATCDEEIREYVESIGGKAVMTADTHERCTERTAEALQIIESETGRQMDIVLMVQGDEPMLEPSMIEEVLRPLIDNPKIQVANLSAPLKNQKEHEDPNEVKVVVDLTGNALYFSREPIPSRKKGANNVPMLKQVCLIPFRRDFLLEFNSLAPTPLEVIESVDMMRVLEHGYAVKMIPTVCDTYSVDTPEDLKHVEELMKNKPLNYQIVMR